MCATSKYELPISRGSMPCQETKASRWTTAFNAAAAAAAALKLAGKAAAAAVAALTKNQHIQAQIPVLQLAQQMISETHKGCRSHRQHIQLQVPVLQLAQQMVSENA